MKKLLITLLLCSASFGANKLHLQNDFSAGKLAENMKPREDLKKYHSGSSELQNFFPLPQGPVEKRPGTEFIQSYDGNAVTTTTSNDYSAYQMTYISESGGVWGVPIIDTTPLSLDVGGVAVNLGGGKISLPCEGHPFEAAQTVVITGTTSYNATEVLQAETDANNLVVLASYNAETFNANSRVAQKIAVGSGAGRMAQDSSGNLYYGHTYNAGTCVTKIEADGDIVTDFFVPSAGWPGTGYIAYGVKVTEDNSFLYVNIVHSAGIPKLYKFNLTDGSEVWSVSSASCYDLDVDDGGNAYMANRIGTTSMAVNIHKFAAADGAETTFQNTGLPNGVNLAIYGTIVDDDAGKIIVIGNTAGGTAVSGHYNIAVFDIDGSNPIELAIGGVYQSLQWQSYLIPTGWAITFDGYIYVITANETIYKYDMSLNLQTSVISSGLAGIFIDLWNNIVIAKQTWTDPELIFDYYDTDLNFITSIEGYHTSMLRPWVASTGGSWMQGNACFWPGLNSSSCPVAVSSSTNTPVSANTAERLIPFEYSVSQSYVLALGHEYIGFFKP